MNYLIDNPAFNLLLLENPNLAEKILRKTSARIGQLERFLPISVTIASGKYIE